MKKRGKLAYMREILYDYPILKIKDSLNPQEQERIKVVDDVLASCKQHRNADELLKLINLVYFDKSYNLSDAAYEISISERTAYRLNRFIMLALENRLCLI